jgi:hypothetical protein
MSEPEVTGEDLLADLASDGEFVDLTAGRAQAVDPEDIEGPSG